VTRYLLDTNILSNVTKPFPSPTLVDWLSNQVDEDLYISSLTIAEIRRGIFEKRTGKKRKQLEEWFVSPESPVVLFKNRILPFDQKAGLIWADLMSQGTISGKPKSALDMIIAATAIANECVIVTDNERDFAGLQILNPLRSTHP
jgi:predicted nucleic acid-binding protein